MARVVCQVLHRSERISFLWSEGAASFEPYHLEGAERARLLELAAQIHKAMANGDAAAIGGLGQQLHRAVFRLDAGDDASAAVHAWLTPLLAGNQIEKLEFLSDLPGLIAWQALNEDGNPQQCWGLRFNLGAGRRVNALRSSPVLTDPLPLLAADVDLVDRLPEAQRPLLAPLRDAGRLLHGRSSLEDELTKRIPDILLLLIRFQKGQMLLGGEPIGPRDLQGWMAEAASGNPDPIVILMGCGEAAEQAAWQATLSQMTAAFSGVIANEALLQPGPAFGVGYAFAQRLMEGKGSVGDILKGLRQEQPAALAFSAFCPPQVRVGGEAVIETEIRNRPLPALPYRPFAAYDAADRALFFGREDDVIRGALALDENGTAGLVLHGSPAVGKTSYLQAGLLPYLEQESVGYRVLRDRSPLDGAVGEKEYPILVLRCTSDLAGQFADALSVFCAQPLTYVTPAGKEVTVDLPNLLHEAVTGASLPKPDDTAIQPAAAPGAITAGAAPEGAPEQPEGQSPRELWIRLRDDKTLLARLLEEITRSLPFELVIAVDQGEEMLTLVSTTKQQERRRKALDMLAEAAGASLNCKIIYVLRSQFVAELEALFPASRLPDSWRAFRLRPLSETELADAFAWPTQREEIPYTEEVPHQKYRFGFEEGAVQQIVADAIEAADAVGYSPLPILQAVGALVYDRQVVVKKQDTIRFGDVKDAGGVRNAFSKYFELALSRLPFSKASRAALKRLIARLYSGRADGTISRELLPASELSTYWRGGTEPVEAVVNQAAEQIGLFDIQHLFIGGESDVYVSLSQDSLARLAKSIDDERDLQAYGRTKIVDTLWIMIPLAFLCATLSFCLTRNFFSGPAPKDGESETEKSEKQDELKARIYFIKHARRPLYVGQLAQAQQALDAESALAARQILVSEPALLAYRDSKDFKLPDLRGFEWRHLWHNLHGERQRFLGQRGGVNAVGVSADGKWAATAGAASSDQGDGTIRIWNLADGKLLALVPGKRAPIFAVSFAPDGKTLAAAGAEKAVQLFDLSKLKDEFMELATPAKTLSGHNGAIYALAYGKDAQTLASAGADGSVIVWDVAAGKPKHQMKEHDKAVRTIVFSSDGKTLASAGDDAHIVLWDAEAGKKKQAIKTDYQAVAALAVAPDGATLASGGIENKSGSERGVIRFWTFDAGKQTHKPIEHGSAVRALAFLGDGSIASGSSDPVIRAFDAKTGEQIRRWLGHLGAVNALAFDKTGASLVSGSIDATAKAWNAQQSTGSDVIHAHEDAALCVAVDPKNRLIASGGRDGTIKLWNPARARLVKELPKLTGAVTALTFGHDPDKIFLAAGSRDDKDEGTIKVWEIAIDGKGEATVKEKQSLRDHAKGITCLAFSPNLKTADMLLSGSADTTVKAWNIDTGKCTETYRGHKGEVRGVAFSRDGRFFASAGRDGLVAIGELGKPDVSALADISPAPLEAIALIGAPGAEDHPDEAALGIVTGASDHALRLNACDKMPLGWQLNPERRFFRSHAQGITGVAENNGLVATASWDGTIKLFSLNLVGQEVLTLRGHQGPVNAIAIAGDQSFLVSAGGDGTLRFWRAPRESK